LSVTWSEVQHTRLKELDASESDQDARFSNTSERNRAYQRLESRLVKRQKQRLKEFRETRRRPSLCILEAKLIDILVQHGFVQVATPIIMSKGLLNKMTICDDHSFTSQIYWLSQNKCLRPMLAPHLYFVLEDLVRLWDKPVRIFEIGTCFRRESQGSQHSSEFTMLNLVEMGLPVEARETRIVELTSLVAETAGIHNYSLQSQKSEIYGETIDVLAGKDGVEVASGAMGPHPLDRAWKITDTWVGIGFGLERLLMAAENCKSIGKLGRSLAYLDGVRLNI